MHRFWSAVLFRPDACPSEGVMERWDSSILVAVGGTLVQYAFPDS